MAIEIGQPAPAFSLPDTNDAQVTLESLRGNMVAITCDTRFSNEAWAKREGIEYPVLSDYWPHGETSQAYGVFNDSFGAATRSTFVLDARGIVTDMIRSEEILVARQFEDYLTALSN